MMLEIELGCTGGEEDGINNQNLHHSKLYTKPDDVAYAYENLKKIGSNFIIAASFGNCHGVYRFGNIKLKPEILKLSQQHVSEKFGLCKYPLNFVFHGGSGSNISDIQLAIKYGVLGNPEGNDYPNKKFYDPRSWLRCAQISMIDKLEEIFHQLNAVDVL
uniref:fructose-bisphosphate aldolase n=1 Tax=Glossina austeni TaxID=7395 RepID=A0A1A9UK99_GLOAU